MSNMDLIGAEITLMDDLWFTDPNGFEVVVKGGVRATVTGCAGGAADFLICRSNNFGTKFVVPAHFPIRIH